MSAADQSSAYSPSDTRPDVALVDGYLWTPRAEENLRSAGALLAADFARGDTQHARRFPFVQWDVFSKVRLAGNPLIVFPDARGLSDHEMRSLGR